MQSSVGHVHESANKPVALDLRGEQKYSATGQTVQMPGLGRNSQSTEDEPHRTPNLRPLLHETVPAIQARAVHRRRGRLASGGSRELQHGRLRRLEQSMPILPHPFQGASLPEASY